MSGRRVVACRGVWYAPANMSETPPPAFAPRLMPLTSETRASGDRPNEFRSRWGLVAASATLMAISSGIWYSGSVFFVALIQDFQSDYASTAGVFAVFVVLYGFWGVLTGSLLDRFGPRGVVLREASYCP